MRLGDQRQEHDRLFSRWNGEPIHPDTLTSWSGCFAKKNELPPVTVHSLRHTNATRFIAAGTNLHTVSARLGHSQASTTASIYAHAIQSADAVAAETLNDILNPLRKRA